MNTGGEDQRWRQQRPQQSTQQRSQGGGQRRSNPGGNANSNGNNAWQGPSQQQQQQQQQQQVSQVYVEPHVPVRGFNGKEVEDFLYRAYQKELDAAKNQGVDQSQKPIIYKSDKGWSTPKSGPWGSRANTMATGTNFLNQLRKSQAAFQNSPKE